jgi:hypothetical protein
MIEKNEKEEREKQKSGKEVLRATPPSFPCQWALMACRR